MSEATRSDQPDAIEEARKRVEEAKKGDSPTEEGAPLNEHKEEKPAPAQPEVEEGQQVKELKSKVEELQKKLNDEDGTRGGQLQQMKNQMAQLNEQLLLIRQENDRLRKEQEERKAQETKPAPKAPSDISAFLEGVEEANQYEDSLLKAIVMISMNVSNAKLKELDPSALKSELDTVKTDLDSVKKTGTTNKAYLAVERLAPGFLEANGDPELGIPAQSEWAEFLHEKVNPNVSDMTYIELIQQSNDVQTTANVFKQFQTVQKASSDKGAGGGNEDSNKKPSIEGQAAPEAGATPLTGESHKADQSKSKASLIEEYNALSDSMKYGQQSLSDEDWSAKKRRLRELQNKLRSGISDE
jgi:hypothetical protein